MPSSTTHCKRTSPVARVALVLALLQVVSGALRPTLRTRVLGLRMGLPEVPIASTHSGIDLERDVYLHPDEKPYSDGSRPAGAPELAQSNFKRQFGALAQGAWETLVGREVTNTTMPECLGLTLSNAAVTNAERRREAANGGVDAHPVSRVLYNVGCFFLDNFFDGRPIQRFWFLETVARIPYFSYTSMLHLYESFGWWRVPELRKVHNAQEWNELHHLLIMEALGGDALWSDRFLALHAAIVYYWLLILTFLFSPRIAYQFMELLEAHAVDTYSTFVKENRPRLEALPPPAVARSYYTGADLYMFDDFMMREAGSRRPPCDSLLDVFVNIAEDEGEHVKTMRACQDYAVLGSLVLSPHLDKRLEPMDGRGSFDGSVRPTTQSPEKRAAWESWASALHEEMRHGEAAEG